VDWGQQRSKVDTLGSLPKKASVFDPDEREVAELSKIGPLGSKLRQCLRQLSDLPASTRAVSRRATVRAPLEVSMDGPDRILAVTLRHHSSAIEDSEVLLLHEIRV